MSVLAPVSSRKIRRAGSQVFCQSRQMSLAAATSARSCSLAFSVFFITVSQRADKSVNRGNVDTNHQSLFNPIAQLRKRYVLILQKLALDLCSMGAQRMTPVTSNLARGNAPFPSPQAGY